MVGCLPNIEYIFELVQLLSQSSLVTRSVSLEGCIDRLDGSLTFKNKKDTIIFMTERNLSVHLLVEYTLKSYSMQ